MNDSLKTTLVVQVLSVTYPSCFDKLFVGIFFVPCNLVILPFMVTVWLWQTLLNEATVLPLYMVAALNDSSSATDKCVFFLITMFLLPYFMFWLNLILTDDLVSHKCSISFFFSGEKQTALTTPWSQNTSSHQVFLSLETGNGYNLIQLCYRLKKKNTC